jgi:serine/threonine-protein kinase
MGRVYQASDVNGTLVALKIVRAELGRDDVFRRRFAREAALARRVRNDHVVRVLDTGEHEGVPYLVQEFIFGESLEQRLRRDGLLPYETALAICAQVAVGLDALRDIGMVHRDVKPGNVLLGESGGVYITDFGVAKDGEGTVLTRPGETIGSLDYMAPEQVRGEEVTAATDVYALGCVMCECLRGRPPFADRPGLRVLSAHLLDAPPDPTAELDDLPPTLGPALLTALQKRPADRPQRASDYARALYAATDLTPPGWL